jgi:hypothetical protein
MRLLEACVVKAICFDFSGPPVAMRKVLRDLVAALALPSLGSQKCLPQRHGSDKTVKIRRGRKSRSPAVSSKHFQKTLLEASAPIFSKIFVPQKRSIWL